MTTVSYVNMADMTKLDTELVMQDADEDAKALPDRLLATLRGLAQFQGPVRVHRLEHSLQSATRAHRDGRDEEYVVAALLHDIGDHLAPYSHGEYVAAVLKPYVPERVCWVIQHHPIFQAYYYAHHLGGNRDARLAYADHPWYADCVEFCERYDQNCFDPEYDSLPVEYFEPMVRRVVAEPRYALWLEELYGPSAP
jgi:predicted HD phosphohydrolase